MESSLRSANGDGAAGSMDKINSPQSAALSPRLQWGLYIGALAASDILLSVMALVIAGWIRSNVILPFFNVSARPNIPPFWAVTLGFIPLWLLVFAGHGLYLRRNLLGGTQEYAGIFRATTIGVLIIVIFGFFQPLQTPARGWVLLAWFFSTLFVIAGRFVLRRVVYRLRRRGYFLSPALIIGANAEACSLAEQLLLWQTSGLSVQGFVTTGQSDASGGFQNLPAIGTLDQLDELVARYDIGELVLATSALDQEQILSIFKRFGVSSDVNVRISSGLFEIITTGLEVKEVASVPLLRVNQVRLTGVDWVFKTILDVVLALAMLILFLPVLGAIALAVKLDSSGPVIYRRRVMGLNGSQFDAYKFRTMYTNGDDIITAHPAMQTSLAENHKLKRDPRVTRVGRFLRKYSLDELPQLANVLRRQMSVVGPRMIAPGELSMYEQWDLNLLTIPPGITGLWQVSGRSDIPYAERVQLDMRYIRNWSILLDLHILFRTFQTVISGKGAY